MRIGIIGAGPAGLFSAYLIKQRHVAADVVVYEQNPKDATFGFGVVFSERALPYLREADSAAYATLEAAMQQWDDITIARNEARVPVDGNGFSAIGRMDLLNLLAGMCRDMGVDIRYNHRVEDVENLAASVDLLIGADGINSHVRDHWAQTFAPDIRYLTNRFAWYGAPVPFDTLTLTFRDFEGGAYVAHHYRYQPRLSTFIVECDAATWEASGLAHMTEQQAADFCAGIFAPELGGQSLLCNKSHWRQFPVITNRNWTHDNVVLIGDALRSVHFSIGSGTRLALEDSIALVDALTQSDFAIADGLARFVAERRPVVDKMLAAAANSYLWYEAFGDLMHLSAWDLAYSYMTRSGRMSQERLAQIAPRFTNAYENHRRQTA